MTRPLTGAEVDTLVALIENGPLMCGYEPSKQGRNDLIERGYAVQIIHKMEDGWTAATYAGREAYKEHFGTSQDGKADTVREARANRLAKCAIISARHQP